MISVINDTKEVKARKSHVCNLCGYTIFAGEKYYTEVIKNDDVIYSFKTHKNCNELVSLLKMESDEGITQDIFCDYISEYFNDFDLKEKVKLIHEKLKK